MDGALRACFTESLSLADASFAAARAFAPAARNLRPGDDAGAHLEPPSVQGKQASLAWLASLKR